MGCQFVPSQTLEWTNFESPSMAHDCLLTPVEASCPWIVGTPDQLLLLFGICEKSSRKIQAGDWKDREMMADRY
jgi:hypothetical protein